MKRIGAGQHFGALSAAVAITFSLVWALSAYAYGGAPSPAFDASAARVAQARACS